MFPAPPPPSAESAGQPFVWRVPPRLPASKLVVAALVWSAGWLLSDGDPLRPVLAGLTALALTGWAVRDIVMPVRLAADADGMTVSAGLIGTRRVVWSQVDRIRVDDHSRLGVRRPVLEIDTGETIHVLGRYDLGAEPEEVAAVLRDLHTTGTQPC